MLAELQALAERVRLCQQRIEEEKEAFKEVSLPGRKFPVVQNHPSYSSPWSYEQPGRTEIPGHMEIAGLSQIHSLNKIASHSKIPGHTEISVIRK